MSDSVLEVEIKSVEDISAHKVVLMRQQYTAAL
jgi:hypothetical protein